MGEVAEDGHVGSENAGEQRISGDREANSTLINDYDHDFGKGIRELMSCHHLRRRKA